MVKSFTNQKKTRISWSLQEHWEKTYQSPLQVIQNLSRQLLKESLAGKICLKLFEKWTALSVQLPLKISWQSSDSSLGKLWLCMETSLGQFFPDNTAAWPTLCTNAMCSLKSCLDLLIIIHNVGSAPIHGFLTVHYVWGRNHQHYFRNSL